MPLQTPIDDTPLIRHKFGGAFYETVFTESAGDSALRVAGGTVNLTFWDAETNGTQYTDLLFNGVATATIKAVRKGQIPRFEGPEGVSEMWVSANAGARSLIPAHDSGGSVGDPSIGLAPATTGNAGAVELATPAEASVGEDDRRANTPASTKAQIDAILAGTPFADRFRNMLYDSIEEGANLTRVRTATGKTRLSAVTVAGGGGTVDPDPDTGGGTVDPDPGTGGNTGGNGNAPIPSGKIAIGDPPASGDTQFWAGVYQLNHTLPAGAGIAGKKIVVAVEARPVTADLAPYLTDNLGDRLNRVVECVGGDTTPAPVGGGGGGSAPATFNVMPLGDSLTAVDNSALGWKGYLLDQLVAAGRSVNYVGSQTATGPAGLKDPHHEGHSGWQNSNFQPVIGGYISTYQPHIVVAHVGTNDIWSNILPDTAIARLRDNVTKIFAAKSDVALILCKIAQTNVGKDAALTSYNNGVAGVVSDFQAQGRNIRLVDMSTVVTKSYLQGDGIHWVAFGPASSNGHLAAANALYPVVQDVMANYGSGTVTPPAGDFAPDSGPTKVAVYEKTARGGETTVSVPPAGGTGVDESTFSGLVSSHTFNKQAGDAWEPVVATFGTDNLTGTTYTAKASTNLNLVTDDVLMAVTGMNSNEALPTSLGLIANGATLDNPVDLNTVPTAGGNDALLLVRAARVSAGFSTSAPEQVATTATNSSGVTAFLKFRTAQGAAPTTPTDPTPVDPTPGTVTSAPLPYPTKVSSVYVMLWSNSKTPPLENIPTAFNVWNLSFLQGDPPRLVGNASEASEAIFLSKLKARRDAGVRMVGSVGGGGGYVNTGNRTAFVQGFMAVNAKIPLDGIDWDIESGTSLPVADVVWISRELKRLRGPDFAVTLAPNGSNVLAYLDAAKLLHAEGLLTMYGQQFYDAPVTKEAAEGRINQAKTSYGIPENKIAVGMMIADGANYWTIPTAVTNINYLKGKFPQLKGGYLWEAGRAGTDTFAAQVSPLLKS